MKHVTTQVLHLTNDALIRRLDLNGPNLPCPTVLRRLSETMKDSDYQCVAEFSLSFDDYELNTDVLGCAVDISWARTQNDGGHWSDQHHRSTILGDLVVIHCIDALDRPIKHMIMYGLGPEYEAKIISTVVESKGYVDASDAVCEKVVDERKT